jgi:hypothetical protein
MLAVMERVDDKDKAIAGTYQYALESIADAIHQLRQTKMGERPIGNGTTKQKPKPKKPPAAKETGKAPRSAMRKPAADDAEDGKSAEEKKTAKRAKQKEKKKEAASRKKAKEREPLVESPKGALSLDDKTTAAAAKADAKTAEKKGAMVSFAKTDKFQHPNLQGIGTEEGNYKEVMADFVLTVSTMVGDDHPGAALDTDRLCLSDICRQEGCRFYAARFPDHPPMRKRDKDKTLMNGTGECGYCHIDDEKVREEVLKKAHAIRVDIWDSLDDDVKKDNKCRYDAKAAAYKASKNGV